MRSAFFPIDGIVTCSCAIEESATTKAWTVGREGMGIPLCVERLHAIQGPGRAGVQVGGRAFRLSESALRSEFRRGVAPQHLLLRYVLALIFQASQLSVCNLYHSVDQRRCRFLSRAFGGANGDEIFITQDGKAHYWPSRSKRPAIRATTAPVEGHLTRLASKQTVWSTLPTLASSTAAVDA